MFIFVDIYILLRDKIFIVYMPIWWRLYIIYVKDSNIPFAEKLTKHHVVKKKFKLKCLSHWK